MTVAARRLTLVIAMLLTAGVVVAGTVYWKRHRAFASQTQADNKDQAMAGMPGMKAESPAGRGAGSAPSPADAKGRGSPESASASAEPPPTVFIAPERQQLIGVKLTDVEQRSVSKTIRSVARVAVDERQTARIHTKIAGWIDRVFINFVGEAVKRGQPLFTIYSPDLVASQEEYLLALRAQHELGISTFERVAEGGNILANAARRRLELWDLTPEQINEIERTGTVSRTMTVYSPVTGVVMKRGAYQAGQRVTPDEELYTIVNLSSVWLLGQVFESELPLLRMGQTVKVEFPYGTEGPPLTGRITFISPFVDPMTRAGEVRMEFPNPNGRFRPDAFYNAVLEINLGRQLVVPAEAVMDTGERQYVFVDVGQGYFEPRPVEAGPEAGKSRVIVKGLKAGERVVTAANFLIDAESRLRGAFAGMGKPTTPSAQAPGTGTTAVKAEITTEPSPAKVGKNRVSVRVLDASGAPVQNAEVEFKLFMPQMGAMGQMEAHTSLLPAGTGVYTGDIEAPMAWTWEATVTVRKDGKIVGVSRSNVVVR